MSAGLRPIVVAGRRFRWRFKQRLAVVPEGRSGPVLYVGWGWRDWLEPERTGPEPRIVTPRFVSQAIAFALARGWQPEEDVPRGSWNMMAPACESRGKTSNEAMQRPRPDGGPLISGVGGSADHGA